MSPHRYVFLLLMPLLLLLMAGCTKNEVKLQFRLPEDVNSPCRVLYYASGKNVGVVRETVAEISGGKGELTLPLHYPALISLFSQSQRVPVAYIYAERGDKFTITGKDGNVAEWSIKGNKTTEELSEWRLANSEVIKNSRSDAEALKKAIETYVKAHPGSPSAAIILFQYYPRRGNETSFYALRNSLDKNLLHDERLMNALSAGDLMTQLPDKPVIPKQIILKGDSGYADTVSLGKGVEALLMFRGGNDTEIRPDSLKALASRLKKGQAVEIYMDLDSLNWRRHLKRDTVPQLKRLWMPLALTDSLAMEMGVRRLPYFIVVGAKGKELYRGEAWEEAVKKFEKP